MIELCLVDSATTHTILRNNKYFMSLVLIEGKVNIISSPVDLIKSCRIAMFILANGMELCIYDALYSPKSRRNLLSFKDIRHNEIKTIN